MDTPLQAKIEQITVLNEYYDEVFDLTVDGVHEYFANGILVHNCDPSCLVLAGNLGKKMYLKKLCYQKTPTSDLLWDLIEAPILEEEKRRYIEANGEEWYETLCDLRNELYNVASLRYENTEKRAESIAQAKENLAVFKDNGIEIDKIVVVCDTQDVYKGRGAADEQQFVTDLNRLSVMYGYYWNFIKVGSKPIVPGISLMKKFDLFLVEDEDVKKEKENYVFIKDSAGNPTNIPDKDSKFCHFWDASRYVIWRMFKHLVIRDKI